MKQNLLRRLTWLHLFLWVGLLQPDGFAERTLVRDLQGFRPIEQFVVGNQVVVVADGGALQPYSITHTMSYVADAFIKIQVKDICICAAPNQKFYSCTRNDWVSANTLNVSEQLLCGNGKVVSVDAVETVHKQQKMHTFSVETSHIFCVTPYEIIAHNIEPISTAGAMVICSSVSLVCPPAGAALAIGNVVACGVMAYVVYRIHKRTHNHDIQPVGCFSPESRTNTLHNGGCYQPVLDIPVVCDIKAGKELEVTKATPYINPEPTGNNVVCEFPAAAIEKPVLHEAATKETDCDQQKRYEGPWYNRTEDWIKEHPFGQKISKSLLRTDYMNQGKRVFKVIDKIEGCDGFNKGDFVVIDALHKDHLEIFNKRGKWIGVANFDGTKNHDKTTQGEKEPRDPLS